MECLVGVVQRTCKSRTYSTIIWAAEIFLAPLFVANVPCGLSCLIGPL